MIRSGLLIAACAVACAGLVGCEAADKAAALDKETLAKIDSQSVPQAQGFSTADAAYLLGTPVEVRTAPPDVLRREVTLIVATDRPLRDIAGLIEGKLGIPIDVDLEASSLSGAAAAGSTRSQVPVPPGAIPPPPTAFLAQAGTGGTAAAGSGDVDRGPMIKVNYHGTYDGLLDLIAVEAGVSWKYDAGRIRLFDVETKTFAIPALAWKVMSKGSIVASAGASAQSSGSGAGGGGSAGGSTSTTTGSTEIDNSETSDVWERLESIARTTSGGAQVFADSSVGTITVTGTPRQIAKVEAWVRTLSESLMKQVALEVHIYTVQLNQEDNYGLSPVLKVAGLGGGVSIPVIQGSASPLTLGGTILKGPFAGTGGFVQALSSLGSVTQNYEQTAVTLNGQPVPIQVGQQTGYLASSSSTLAANVGSQTTLSPGFVTTGFTGLFVPRVAGHRILLGMNVTISNLVSLQTVSSSGQSIQVPTTANSTFQQSVSLESGSTLLLTGFRNNNSKTNQTGVFSADFWGLGGGADSTLNRQLIAIVINARTL